MRLYTVHAEQPSPPGIEGWPEPKARPPVLLREGFSPWAFLFGAFWFLANRLWWEGVGLLALTLGAAFMLPEPFAPAAVLVLHLIAGAEARDRLRARLARQGLPEVAVVAAPDLDIAWFRLGQQRPDLVRAAP